MLFLKMKSAAISALLFASSSSPFAAAVNLVVQSTGGNASSPIFYGLMHEVGTLFTYPPYHPTIPSHPIIMVTRGFFFF